MTPVPKKNIPLLVTALIVGGISIAIIVVAITISGSQELVASPAPTLKATPSSLLPLAPRQTYPKQGSEMNGSRGGFGTPAAQLPLFPDTYPSEAPFDGGILNGFR